ncbi:MAG: porin [Colwellia sp.]|nr:porin [Colwellia sp.]
MKQIRSSLLASLILGAFTYSSQAIEVFNNGKTDFNIEGNVSVFFVKNDEFSEISDGFSRYLFHTSHTMTNDWKALAKLEWGVQVSNTDNQIVVNHNGLTSTGPSEDNVWLRQGYVGVAHDKYGSFTMGKQWGVTYNITGVTDVFDIFGAEAAGVYNFGTDGGFSGTGRAEQAMQYNWSNDKLTIGVQYQATEEIIDLAALGDDEPEAIVNFSNSYGFSLVYQAPYSIGLGIGYNKAKISLSQQPLNNVSSLNDISISAHITYSHLRAKGFQMSLVYAAMENHEWNDAGKVMNKSTGIELHSSYRFDNDIALVLGFNSLKDDSKADFGSNGLFHKKYIVVGAKYHWIEEFHLYTEFKIDSSTASDQGVDLSEDAFGIGMAYEF